MTAPATWAGTPAGGPVFFLGTHQPHWLARTEVPLFISHRALARRSPRRPLPRARGPWALDSGGFTELSTYGEWRTTPAAYVAAVCRYATEIGNLAWAAPQDWMCDLGYSGTYASGFPDGHAYEDWLYRLERLTDNHARLSDGEHVSGPAAGLYRHRVHAGHTGSPAGSTPPARPPATCSPTRCCRSTPDGP